MMKIIETLFLVILFTSCQQECVENRAAVDIGSGTTKMLVVQFNKCTNKIEKEIFSKNVKISFKEDLQKHDGKLSQKIINEGTIEFKKLISFPSSTDVKKIRGVATSAFRQATNGKEALETISSKFNNLKTKIITQKEEAKLGVLGVTKGKSKNVTIWDIGGSSQQISLIDKNGKVEIGLSRIASVSFKNLILTAIQGKKLTAITPNPISKDYKKALSLSFDLAKYSFSQKLQDQISKTEVIGIGGVHYYSIYKNALKKGPYTIENLMNSIEEGKELKDSELDSKYADTDVSNQILVAGHMKALGISKITPKKLNLTHGVFYDKTLWE